ncbi:hypothetical protein PR048_031229 [Dryococelus australis]|uniref:Uncharacterized protein n=1 Tax=Dryococelus australis TaxID=614101 RepID=A0ABQ9G4N1_9NEOP|nr:hypothetical protein PR048_031229 [Dryococelus australis]
MAAPVRGRLRPSTARVNCVVDVHNVRVISYQAAVRAGGDISIRSALVNVEAVGRRSGRNPRPARLPPRRSGFNPRPGHSGFSHVGIVPDDAVWSPGLLGDLPFPLPFHSGSASYLKHPSSALKTSLLRAAKITTLISSPANKTPINNAPLNNEVLKANEGGVRRDWSGARENPPTSAIVRHDSHVRGCGVTGSGIEPGSPGWEASSPTTAPPRPHERTHRVEDVFSHSHAANNQRKSASLQDAAESVADHKNSIDDSDSVEDDDYSLDSPAHFPSEFPSTSDVNKAEDIEYTDYMFTEDPNKLVDRLKYLFDRKQRGDYSNIKESSGSRSKVNDTQDGGRVTSQDGGFPESESDPRSPCKWTRREKFVSSMTCKLDDCGVIFKCTDINCTLVVRCQSGRRRLGERPPMGVKHREDQWLNLYKHTVFRIPTSPKMNPRILQVSDK